MAFKMIRPVIKGSPIYKTSIAKAKSIVANTRTTADPSLISAGEELGKSYVPGAIDYSLTSKDIAFDRQRGISTDAYGRGCVGGQCPPPEEEEEEVTEIESRQIKSLPTKKNLDKLLSPSTTPKASGKDTDRFIDAAEDFGMEINSVEDYNRAEERMFYDDDTDKWALKPADTTPAPRIKPKKMEIGGNVDDQLALSTGEIPESNDTDIFVDAAEKKGYDMTTQKGWEEAEKHAKYNEEEDKWEFFGVDIQKPKVETDQNLLDIQQQQQEEQKRKKELKLLKLEKEKQLRLKLHIEKYEKEKINAKEFYDEHGEKLNQESFDEYLKMKEEGTLDSYGMPEIEQESDIEPWEEGYKEQQFIRKDANNNGMPDYLEREPKQKTQIQREMDDFNVTDLEREKSGPIEQQRDDRIWRNATQGGTVQQSMRKNGYIPFNER